MAAATRLTPAEFFYLNAGFSYDPHRQTREEGRVECARALAMAERWASERGVWFDWQEDDQTAAQCVEGIDEGGDYGLWRCLAYADVELRGSKGRDVVASLGGIDLGPDGEPSWHSYRRVAEAGLALEAMGDEQLEASSSVGWLDIRSDVVRAAGAVHSVEA